MARQEIFKQKKNFFSAFSFSLSPILCIEYLHYASTKPPHWQKHLLSHKEQHSRISKTAP